MLGVQNDPFRDHMIAAPLKLAMVGDPGVEVVGFPRSHDRGSIEATCSGDCESWRSAFRDHMIAAPLKLFKLHPVDVALNLSAIT